MKKVKSQLDKYSNVSFNYTIEKGYINIIPYTVTSSIGFEEFEEVTKLGLRVTQRLNYFKQRNGLNTKQLKHLRSVLMTEKNFDLFNASFDVYKVKCKENKIKLTHYQGNEFLEKMQNILIYLYSKSQDSEKFPDNYPKLMY